MENTKRENLFEITPVCYLVKTQSGYRKLLKRLNIYNGRYRHNVYQMTNDKNAFDKEDENGKTCYYHKNFPIKYPCIISYDDNTFECGEYSMTIRYFDEELCNILKFCIK